MIYLTYGDQPSGVFESQVVDKCKVRKEFNKSAKIQIITILPIRNFFNNYNKIKIYRTKFKEIYTFPAVPLFPFWKLNILTLIVLSFIFDFKKVHARGVYAAYLALILKRLKITKEVFYDGRGATYEECKEYKMINHKYLKSIYNAEKTVVTNSDFCYAVSQKLIDYWKANYSFIGNYQITPCLPGNNFKFSLTKEYINQHSIKTCFKKKDIVIGFCGGVGGWQSYEMLNAFFRQQISYNTKLKLLLLCPKNSIVDSLLNDFPGSVMNNYVSHDSVKNYLFCCDYGFLIREETKTNNVASPVKFGEYLICGLKILISNNIGDYSKLVHNRNLGHVISDLRKEITLKKSTTNQKINIHNFYKKTYMKHNNGLGI